MNFIQRDQGGTLGVKNAEKKRGLPAIARKRKKLNDLKIIGLRK